MDPSTLDDAFLAGASVCRDFLHGAGVDGHWADPSALPAMSTGALACHLSRQVRAGSERSESTFRDRRDRCSGASIAACPRTARRAPHGQAAVVGTLTRRERTQPISAF